MRISIGTLTLAAMLVAAPAYADWYGEQVVASDALGIGSFYVAGKVPDGNPAEGALLISGVFFTLIGPSLVHAHHDNYDSMKESLGLRIALPVAGFAIGHLLDPACRNCWVGARASFGMAAGYVAAAILDAALLARTDDPTAARVISFSIPLP